MSMAETNPSFTLPGMPSLGGSSLPEVSTH